MFRTHFLIVRFISRSYYNLEDVTHEVINKYLSSLVQKSLIDLTLSNCIREEVMNCLQLFKLLK